MPINSRGEDLRRINIGIPEGSTGIQGINIEGTLKDSITKGGWPRRSNRTGMHHPGTEDLLKDSRRYKETVRTSARIAKGRFTGTQQAVSFAVGAVI
jgi:hypothetical protein